MGPLVIMVVLVCGYWYTENHYPSRTRQARSSGWIAYFYVAMHGAKFALQGFFGVALIYVALFLLSLLLSVPHLFFPDYAVQDYYSWLTRTTLMNYPLFFELGLALAALRAWRAGEAARRAMRDGKSSMAEYRKVAREDGMESLLLQAIEEEKLVFVTLKSRKVYIGYVAAPRIEHTQTQHLALIPYISGYRDKETLRFCEQHRYYELYLAQNITPDSEPLNLQHFRHLIPMAEVEAVSLFDVATYKIFDQFSVTPQAE
ncbi:MAG: hypothetical protein E7J63_04225 [Pantoea sp.]|uniref:hypothetical protein n=1 Tax=Pantoea TaxID=53335 RepID=UPI00257FFAAF|nr:MULTISPECIES: hypothetical protein [Pantoea]MDU1573532.1 hypothetical protein [Pantoea sp.]MDU5472807.1 hypothetical protein [Pantoea sp.]MDU7837510.1 hypothetical protein [Pantoea sp.]